MHDVNALSSLDGRVDVQYFSFNEIGFCRNVRPCVARRPPQRDENLVHGIFICRISARRLRIM